MTYQAVASLDPAWAAGAGDSGAEAGTTPDGSASSRPGRRLSERELLAALHPNGQRLHRELFGTVDLEVSAPALVRDGHLAPYQELAWFTSPTSAEMDYIGGQALRFAELRAGLLDPGFASTPFLAWLQQRVVERRAADTGAQLSWEHFAKDQPALADAALRLHCDGMLPLPHGAAVREQHRHPPTAEDWVALIGDYCRHCLLPGADSANRDAAALDKAAYDAVRTALPSIGYRLTRAGIRAAESPVDRVLARSASKAVAAVEILRAEHGELGDQLRALGALVGTRALLGEGWDAPAVNVTVDLTAATTPTSVVQARGRALRRDAGWPEKVADNWAVVCVTDAHPKGATDYDRFVRKHTATSRYPGRATSPPACPTWTQTRRHSSRRPPKRSPN